MQTVMACIDFSDTSVPVLDEASRLADALGARIILLHVDQPDAELIGADVGYVPPPMPKGPVEERPSYKELHRRAKRLEEPGREVQVVYDEGAVVDRIIHQARLHDVDTLVMGSHGHGALYHLLMGSVTEGVLKKFDRPVLVVPAMTRVEAAGKA